MTFLLSQYHIIFVYPNNITIISSISEEIVYSKNFDQMDIKYGVFDVKKRYVLLQGNHSQQAGSSGKKYLEYSAFDNEDRNAWRQFLKKGKIKEALDSCSKK